MVDSISGRGLLSRLEPTGGTPNAFLDTDGGGRQATDGGGRPRGSGHSTLVSEALRRSHAGITQGRGSTQTLRGSMSPSNTPPPTIRRHGLGHWAPWVRIELARDRLMSRAMFDWDPKTGFATWSHRDNLGKKSFAIARVQAPQTLAALQQQTNWVLRRARLREDRFPEIHVQSENLWPFWDALIGLDAAKIPHTLELLHASLQFASAVVQQMKHHLGVPRPMEMSPLVMPLIETPGHGAMPSGHATAAAALSMVLKLLHPADPSLSHPLRRLAFRVAFNREVAGLHYPMDSAAGRVLGETLGAYVQAAATGGLALIKGAEFEGQKIDLALGLGDDLARQTGDGELKDLPCSIAPSKAKFGAPDDVVKWLWERAAAEIAALRS